MIVNKLLCIVFYYFLNMFFLIFICVSLIKLLLPPLETYIYLFFLLHFTLRQSTPTSHTLQSPSFFRVPQTICKQARCDAKHNSNQKIKNKLAEIIARCVPTLPHVATSKEDAAKSTTHHKPSSSIYSHQNITTQNDTSSWLCLGQLPTENGYLLPGRKDLCLEVVKILS